MNAVRNYVLVTAAYWAFTLTDGALRMLVLLHFHELGYSPVELGMLSAVDPAWSRVASVVYVMAAQSLSGIAKDLTKMSAKSSIKVLVPEGRDSLLFKWVAVLTGSKNALKGVGFFLGGLLLTSMGFKQ